MKRPSTWRESPSTSASHSAVCSSPDSSARLPAAINRSTKTQATGASYRLSPTRMLAGWNFRFSWRSSRIPLSLTRKILSGSAARIARLQRPEVVVSLHLEPDGGGDLLEQLGLVEESLVVDDRRERTTVSLDRRDRAARLGAELARPAVEIDATSLRPGGAVENLGGRIVQEAPDPVLDSAVGLLRERTSDLRASEPTLQ